MAEYALVGPADQISQLRQDVNPAVATKPGWRWLPVVETKPGYDPVTQVREGPVATVGVSDVTRVWTVRAKTAPELDADKETRLDAIDRAQWAVMFELINEIRVLKAQAPLTVPQFRNYVKGKY